MYNLWSERPPLAGFEHKWEGLADLLPPASDDMTAPLRDLPQAHAALAGIFRYDAELMNHAPNLLVIARTGIGYDLVDVEEATQRGIAVCNSPDGPTISTAEMAITLMMGVARNIKAIEHELRTVKKTSYYGDYRGMELYGKTLGVIGFGRIARHVARIGQGMGMQVIAYDPFVGDDIAETMMVRLTSELSDLLEKADVVSVHIPYNEQTHKLMNAARFAQMKEGAIFVNTARGGIVDEDALLEVLESGHLWGAGLDVTDPEPPLAENPLLQRSDVILTPHVASGTTDGKNRIFEMTIDQIVQVLNGEKPTHLINPEVWEKVVQRRNSL